ncbi:hypothetical protein BDV93DRAFT_548543 [Ceratobasidium sp. AG-I]|nr:hypothetical protein BDV93DRAFT_548543 [Ceratobasidium sp. AG-I]
MVLLFSIVVAFVVAQCVFCILYGSSYAVPAVTVASAVGMSKGAALEFQSQVTTGVEVVRFCTYKEEVSVVNQIFEPHHLFAQCPANDAPAQTQSPHTAHPPPSSLLISSPKKSPILMDVSPRSESPMRRTTRPLDNRSIAEPLFSADPNPHYNPPYDDSNNGTTRPLLIGFVLCFFGALFGSALVIKRAFKSVLSQLFGGLNLVLLYVLLAGDGVRVHRQNGPLAQMFISQPSSSSQTPVGSDDPSQSDRRSYASIARYAGANAQGISNGVTITLSNAHSVLPVNPTPTTTPQNTEAKRVTEAPSPQHAATHTETGAGEINYSSDPSVIRGPANSPTSLSNASSSISQIPHDETEAVISLDLVSALTDGFASLSLSEDDPNTHPSLPTSDAESSSQAQPETVVHSTSVAPGSIYLNDEDSHSYGSTDVSVDSESGSQAGETAPTANEPEPEPEPAHDNDQAQHDDSDESEPFTAEAVTSNAEPVHPNAATPDPAPATAATPTEDIVLPHAAPLTTTLASFLGSTQSLAPPATVLFLPQPNVTADNEIAHGPGDLDVEGQADNEMAVEALPPAIHPETLPNDHGAFDTPALTIEAVMTTEPHQDPQPSTSASANPVASSSTDASAQLPRLRKRKTFADSAHREEDVQVKHSRPIKKQRTIIWEEFESAVGSSQASQAVLPIQPATPSQLTSLAQSNASPQPSAPVAGSNVTSMERVDEKVNRKRKAEEEACGSSRISKSKKVDHEEYEATAKWRQSKEKEGVKEGMNEKDVEAEKQEKKERKVKIGKEKNSKEGRKKAKRSLKGKEKEVLPDLSTGDTKDPPVDDKTSVEHGEPSHTGSRSSQQLTASVDELAEQFSSTSLSYRSATGLENAGSTSASEQADRDHSAEPTLDTEAGASSVNAGPCEKMEEPSTPPRNTRPLVKLRKLRLIVPEPEPKSKDEEVTPPGSPTLEALRQKGARQLEARKRTEVGASGRGGTGRLVRTHKQPYQAARESKKTRAERKMVESLDFAGTEDIREDEVATTTEEPAEPEVAAGTEAVAGTGYPAETENAVDASGSVETGVAMTAQEISDEAARWLESVMGDLDQSFMPAGASTTPPSPHDASSPDSSDATGDSEPSQVFSTNASMETQDTDLEDYEVAIAGPSTQPTTVQHQPDVQVKQEEEEYVFPPWNGDEAEEQQPGPSGAYGVAGPSNQGEGAGLEPQATQQEEEYVFPPGRMDGPPSTFDDSQSMWSAPTDEDSQPWSDIPAPTSVPAPAPYFWHGYAMAVPAPGTALEMHMANGGFPVVVLPKRQREEDEEEDEDAPAFKKPRTPLSRGVWESMMGRMGEEDKERWARQRWMRKMSRRFGVGMN